MLGLLVEALLCVICELTAVTELHERYSEMLGI